MIALDLINCTMEYGIGEGKFTQPTLKMMYLFDSECTPYCVTCLTTRRPCVHVMSILYPLV